jgi:glycerol-3-phosphate cytidylyltransferase-like family protein
MKQLVIIPGGFHPPHPGHAALYQGAQQAFPNADVYVVSTSDTSNRPLPFEVKKKLARLSGIPADKFVQVKSPFKAQEVVDRYDASDTQLIFVRSDKDRGKEPLAGRLKKDGSPGYLQPYTERETLPMGQRGYMAYLPVKTFGIDNKMKNASEIREIWPRIDSDQKVELVNMLYPMTSKNSRLADTVIKMLDATLLGVQENQGWAATLETEKKTKNKAVQRTDIVDPKFHKDPELYHAAIQAKQHYPQHRDDVELALLKWIQRGLLHSEQKDQNHDQVIRGLMNMVHKLMQRMKELQKSSPDAVAETTVVNDPEKGLLIRPRGGMGTWTEDSLTSSLLQKFTSIVAMLNSKDYVTMQYALKPDGALMSMVQSLADLERFRDRQGRRPVARGREIQLSDDYAKE